MLPEPVGTAVWKAHRGRALRSATALSFAGRASTCTDSVRAIYATGQDRFFFTTDEGEPLAAIFVFTFGEELMVHLRCLE